MERLQSIIDQYGRWQPLLDYIRRIEAYQEADFSICIENAKSLLESIAKEICTQRSQPFLDNDGIGKILKLAFASLGYDNTATIRQIGGAIANIGQQMGILRNEIGATSHGRPLADLEARKVAIGKVSSDFLLVSTELVACFLIQLFETEFPRMAEEQDSVDFNENEDFNEYLDDLYGDFKMGDYCYPASEILFNLDQKAYKTELSAYKATLNEDNNRE